MQAIGVGLGRTGTLSLKAALEQLGAGPCFHMVELLAGEQRERDLPYWVKVAAGEPVDWHEVFDGWGATVDWPAAARWREVCDAFPRAPVLLSVRGFDGWYASVERTLDASRRARDADGAADRTLPDVVDALVWNGDLEGRFEDRERMREVYEGRIAEIRATIAPERLTVWRLGEDGWGPLAAMLGVLVPDEPFPRLNDTSAFRAMVGLPPLAS